jgi:hypothetical protein
LAFGCRRKSSTIQQPAGFLPTTPGNWQILNNKCQRL